MLHIFRAVLCVRVYLFPTTAHYLYMFLHVSAELLSHESVVILYIYKQRTACHRMVKYTNVTLTISAL
jgi:hypothetical protein